MGRESFGAVAMGNAALTEFWARVPSLFTMHDGEQGVILGIGDLDRVVAEGTLNAEPGAGEACNSPGRGRSAPACSVP